jgi:hypothetical protein
MNSSTLLSTDGVNGLVEALEKTRAVLSRKGWRAACNFSCLTQLREKFSAGHRVSYVVLGKRPSPTTFKRIPSP